MNDDFFQICLDFTPYAVLLFNPDLSQNPRDQIPNQTATVTENPPQNTRSSIDYQNLTNDGEPLPGRCRGVVNNQHGYVNTGTACKSRYTRLQLFRPIVIDWLRNAWGNVDQFGRHVYDIMQRVRREFIPYDKMSNEQRNATEVGRNELGAVDNIGNAMYDKFQRSSPQLTSE